MMGPNGSLRVKGPYQLDPLNEDLKLLRGVTADKPLQQERELAAARGEVDEDVEALDSLLNEKKGKKGMEYDETYEGDYSDEEDEDEDEDEDYDEDEHFDGDELTEERAAQYAQLIEAFAELDEDEIDQLDDEQLDAVEEAVYALGIEEDDYDDEEGLEEAKRKFRAHRSKPMNDLRRGIRFAKKPVKAGKSSYYPLDPQGKLLKQLEKNLKKARAKLKGNKTALKRRAQSRKFNMKAGNKQYRTWRGGKKQQFGRKSLKGKIRFARERRRNAGYMGSSREELDNIVEELRGVISRPLIEDNHAASQVEGYTQEELANDLYIAQEQVIEGLQNVGAAAENLADRVAEELREAGLSEDEVSDDPRFELGSYFESIACDAGRLLERVLVFDEDDQPYFDPEVDVDDAIENLNGITSDLEKGLEHAEQIG